MNDICRNFIKLTYLLFKDGVYPAIGSHDDKLIQAVKDYVEVHHISKDSFEFHTSHLLLCSLIAA